MAFLFSDRAQQQRAGVEPVDPEIGLPPAKRLIQSANTPRVLISDQAALPISTSLGA
jgi:hypothetical protein